MVDTTHRHDPHSGRNGEQFAQLLDLGVDRRGKHSLGPATGSACGHPFRSCDTRVSPGGDTNDVFTELAGTRLTHKNILPSHARSVSPIRAADPWTHLPVEFGRTPLHSTSKATCIS